MAAEVTCALCDLRALMCGCAVSCVYLLAYPRFNEVALRMARQLEQGRPRPGRGQTAADVPFLVV